MTFNNYENAIRKTFKITFGLRGKNGHLNIHVNNLNKTSGSESKQSKL